MARNRNYWKERFEALEDGQYRRGKDYYRDVQRQFQTAANNMQMDINRWYQRLADNNDISYAAAKRLLKSNELEEFRWSVEQYIKAGEENAVNQRWMKQLENASARRHISYLEAMKLQIQQHAELLSSQFDGGMTAFLGRTYADGYHHTAYEMAKGTGIGTNLARLDDHRIDMVIKSPWARDGANFSDRIWSNKEKLVNTLHKELSQSVICGESPQKAIDNLSKTMGVSRAQAGRLIMTETAAISSAAQKDSLKKLGVEQYEILATLDSRTSQICQDLDGKVFELKDYEVGMTAPPFHPNCRSTTVPYFDDEFTEGEERAARDEVTGNTYYVPADMTYKDWKEQYVGADETGIGAESAQADYLIRKHKGAGNTMAEKLVVNEAITAVPAKVQAALRSTVIDVGQIGASQYDYDRDILYVAKGAEKEDVIHEIGHLVESKMLDPAKVETLKAQLLQNVPPNMIVTKTYYDAAGQPRDIFLLQVDGLVSEYQGRIYANDWSEIYDENWKLRLELVAEFTSEPFREYVMNPKRLERDFPEFYELIRRAVE